MSALPEGRIDYVTPTQIVDAGYAEQLQRRPRMRRPYRPCDQDVLMRAADAAFQAERAAALSDHDKVADALADEVERLFPPADMRVLARYPSTERWGLSADLVPCARSLRLINVDGENVRLPRPVLAPIGFRSFTLATPAEGYPSLPEAARGYFDRARNLAQDRLTRFDAVRAWPSTFKHKEGRFPTWGEIARAWPQLAKQIEAL